MHHDTLAAEHDRLLPQTRPVDAALEKARLSMLITHPSIQPGDPPRAQQTPFREQLPYMDTHLYTAPSRIHNVIPIRGMLYVRNTPSTPSTEVREALMGFRIGDTAAHALSALQRVHLLGQ